MLVLDPFVRLHRIDPNASGEVAPLQAYLRQATPTQLAVVVHHATIAVCFDEVGR